MLNYVYTPQTIYQDYHYFSHKDVVKTPHLVLVHSPQHAFLCHKLTTEEIRDIFEDNLCLQAAREENPYSSFKLEDILWKHFAHFNFLHHLQYIGSCLPLYLSRPSLEDLSDSVLSGSGTCYPQDSYTVYEPALPPRLFTSLFGDIEGNVLSKQWDVLDKELSCLFAFNIFESSVDQTTYCEDDFKAFKHNWGPDRLFNFFLNEDKSGRTKKTDFIKKYCVLYKGEVWIAQKGMLYPLTLQLSAQLLDHKKFSRLVKKDSINCLEQRRDGYNNFFNLLHTLKKYLPELD